MLSRRARTLKLSVGKKRKKEEEKKKEKENSY